MTPQTRITDDLDSLLTVLPPKIQESLRAVDRSDELLEVILDLGRIPTARYVGAEVVLSELEVTHADIDHVVSRIGEFDADNRAGIPRTLHRISAIRNRRSHIVGLTCRIGRAIYGTIDIIRDLVESGQSILLLGRPGVGKTTMLREAARVLAESKRVVIVDTSNEIGGDGDIPHPAVGRARRMQVSQPSLQHEVMIEAVENHNPEVIVIDEIGRELEAAAARTIAERGVQLIGTAHGITLDNLLLNPTLSDLVGGIESVTLSDEEARRRGTQKTVLERRAPPTFEVLIELQNRQQLAIHPDVAASVDANLRSRPLPVELRYVDEQGQIHIEEEPATAAVGGRPDRRSERPERGDRGRLGSPAAERSSFRTEIAPVANTFAAERPDHGGNGHGILQPLRVHPYGVARNRLAQAAKHLNVPIEIVDDLEDAQAIVTLKNYYRRRPKLISDAERRGVSIYVLRANTVAQMEGFLGDVFNLEVHPDTDPYTRAMEEAQTAIQKVLTGTPSVDLMPQAAYIRRRQHQLAKEYNLISHSFGKEPNRRVRIYRQ